MGTPNICPLDLKTIWSALLHSLLSSTWNGTNSERICSIMEMTLNYAYVIKTVIFVLYIIVVLIPNHWRLVKTFLNHKRGGSEWGAQRWSSAMYTVAQKPHICSKTFKSVKHFRFYILFRSSNTQFYEVRIFCLFTFWVFFPDKSFRSISRYTQKCPYLLKRKKKHLKLGILKFGIHKIGCSMSWTIFRFL